MPFGDWRASSFDIPDDDLLGVGGLPPRLDDPDLAARVLAWIRVRRMNEPDPPIQVRLVDANMVSAEQAVTAAPEMLGAGRGRAGQSVSLSKTPVIQDSEVVQVRTDAGWAAWTRVDDLALAGPDDPFYALDPTAGTVTFGDGVHGRMPLPGQAIRVLAYRHGGGAKGNVGAGGVSRVRGASLRATNPLPAEGGQDAETNAQAQARIPKVLRARDRAVCADDFADIALETPGAMIGRAHVLSRHKPFERADGVPGVVTLIVLPAQDLVTPDTPTPDREVLRKVCAWLEPRRLVTTELYVTPPEYVDVDISIAVDAQAGVGEETLRRWVELALRQHFAPCRPTVLMARAGRSGGRCATATPKPRPCGCRAWPSSTRWSSRAWPSALMVRRPRCRRPCRSRNGSCPLSARWASPSARPRPRWIRTPIRRSAAWPCRSNRRSADPCASPSSRT